MNVQEAADNRLLATAVLLNQVASQKTSPLKLIPVTPEQRTQSRRMAQHLDQLTSERAKLHAAPRPPALADGEIVPLAWKIPKLAEALDGAFTVGQGNEPVVKFLPGVNNPNVLPGVSGRTGLPGLTPGVVPNQLPGAGPGTLQGLGVPPK